MDNAEHKEAEQRQEMHVVWRVGRTRVCIHTEDDLSVVLSTYCGFRGGFVPEWEVLVLFDFVVMFLFLWFSQAPSLS